MVVVIAALLVLLITTLQQHLSQRAGVAEVSGRTAMGDVSLALVDGGTWSLRDYRGKVVAINLWATWCGPCLEETPVLVRMARDLGPRGLAVVGVSVDAADGVAEVRAFAKRFGVVYPLALPDPMSQMSAGMEGIPTTILLDREGRVARTYIGEVRESVLRSDVQTLLTEAGER